MKILPKTTILLIAGFSLIGCGGGGGGSSSDSSGGGSTPPPPSSTQSDTIPPVVVLNGASTVSIDIGDTFTDLGALANDNVDGSITVSKSGSVNTATAGIYRITYTATDNAGNTTSVVRTVNVNAGTKINQIIDAGTDTFTVFGDASFTRNIGNTDLGTGAISCSSSDTTIATVVVNNGNCEVSLVRGTSAKYSFDNTITINVEKSSDFVYNTAVDSFQLTVQGVIHDTVGLDVRDGQCVKFDTTLGKMVITQDGVGVLDLNHVDGKWNIQTGNTNVNHFCVAVENNYVALVSMGPAPVWYTDTAGNEWRYAARYKVNSSDRRVIEAIGFFQEINGSLNDVGVSEVIWSSQTGNGFEDDRSTSNWTVSEQLVDYTFPVNNKFLITAGTTINNCNEQTKADRNGLFAITTQCSVNGVDTIVDHQTRF